MWHLKNFHHQSKQALNPNVCHEMLSYSWCYIMEPWRWSNKGHVTCGRAKRATWEDSVNGQQAVCCDDADDRCVHLVEITDAHNQVPSAPPMHRHCCHALHSPLLPAMIQWAHEPSATIVVHRPAGGWHWSSGPLAATARWSRGATAR